MDTKLSYLFERLPQLHQYAIYMKGRAFLGPLALALSCAIGLYIGTKMNDVSTGITSGMGRYGKLNQLMSIINRDYVDEVDADSLLDATIDEMLHRLDPHSSYITKSEIQEVNENMQGNFQGIGVEFRIIKDTLVVISAVEGGPSERAGIKGGDRMILVEDSLIAGVGMTNSKIIGMLRGEKGTRVRVGMYRPTSKEHYETEIVRDDIPIYSVDVHYMMDDTTGFIKVNRFAESTYSEFRAALTDLLDHGMKKLVLDLRDNPGGYLHTANQMASDLLPDGALIVYTEGRNREKEYHYAKGGGLFESGSLDILINEGSASASEIIAGAVQDNDRGRILGRRSFGKGLVQEQWTLKDGSAIRLTVARYFTPSGRCIQKPYQEGYEEYYLESYHRWDNGEMWTEDSTAFPDSLKFETLNGRTVYGGGGISPDLFIPVDTSGRSSTYYRLVNRAYLAEWSFDFSDEKRTHFDSLSFNSFAEDANIEGLKKNFDENLRSEGFTDLGSRGYDLAYARFRALVARNFWGDKGFYPIIHEIDQAVQATK